MLFSKKDITNFSRTRIKAFFLKKDCILGSWGGGGSDSTVECSTSDQEIPGNSLTKDNVLSHRARRNMLPACSTDSVQENIPTCKASSKNNRF